MADAKFITAPNGLKKAKVGTGRARLDPAVLDRAEKAVEKIQHEYTDWADEDIAAFDVALAALRQDGCDQTAILQELYRLSHDMKGQGGSFGYVMMSEIAASLNDFIAGRTILVPLDIEVVDAHVAALRAVYAQRVRDDGGMTGRALLAGLGKLAARADERLRGAEHGE